MIPERFIIINVATCVFVAHTVYSQKLPLGLGSSDRSKLLSEILSQSSSIRSG